MKLRYIRVRNVLSFGDRVAELEFGDFNVIAGPNDSGKTNLFRALSLIEKAFDYGKPSPNEIFFQGDSDKPLHLEVGVELDDTECELLATLIISSELMSILQQQNITQGIRDDKHWKSILTNYGYQILSKSFRHLSFLLTKDELRTSEPKMVVQLSDETGLLYINRESILSETSQELGSYQTVSLAKEIMEDFTSRFGGNVSEADFNALIRDTQKLSESPTLMSLLKGKLSVSPPKVIGLLRGGDLSQYLNSLRDDLILSKLFQLFERRGIGLERLYLFEILRQMYKTSIVRLDELRVFPPPSDYLDSGHGSKRANIIGANLALKLFWLMSSGNRKNREKYSRIQTEFKNLTESEFDVAVREREVDQGFEENLGVLVPNRESFGASVHDFTPLGVVKESGKRSVNEAFVQIIKENYPVAIEQTASGLYEILFLLTTMIGENEKILLLDEPELHLHPSMQKRILNLLYESKTKGKNQIVLTTHSPYLVSSENLNATWRFTKPEHDTKVHNLSRVLSKLKNQEQGKIVLNLSHTDIKSLLFSRGVIFVEGLSDKIVVEQIDRYLSSKKMGANIDENEWPVIAIGGKKNLLSFMTLSLMLDIPKLAILDYDALMRRDNRIKPNGAEVKTSTIVFTLWCMGKLDNGLINKDLLLRTLEGEWYEDSQLGDLRTLALENGIFVFPKDLEGVMQSQENSEKRKPFKALERIVDLISQESIPSEFYEMCNFLSKHTYPNGNERQVPTCPRG